MKKEVYQESIDEVVNKIGESTSGLSDSFAKEQQLKYGLNELKAAPQKSWIRLFLETFKDAMVIILLIVAVVQMLMGAHIESIVIFAVLLLNSIVSVVQEKKAESSLNALKDLSAPEAKVIRQGKEKSIPAKELVPGDVVLLEAGDYIPADGRIIEAKSLKVDEGMLTGESVPAEKKVEVISNVVPIGDRVNMVFSGTITTYGRAKFIVTATGEHTEIGKVASMLENTTEVKTPLQRGLDMFSKKLSLGILFLSLFILFIQLTRIFLSGPSVNITNDVLNAFMFAIAVAVAAIPEALQSIVTIVLSIGTKKMAKDHAVIRKLSAVETLGSTSVICTDKTGTLTQNKMTVVDTFIPGQDKAFTGKDMTNSERRLLEISILTNDAIITEDNSRIGDPTEIAMVDFGEKLNVQTMEFRKNLSRLDELPFDSERKLMSTLHEIDNKSLILVKGAPDVILQRSSKVFLNDQEVDMTADLKQSIISQNEKFAHDALRVLAFAFKTVDSDNQLSLDDENDLTFVGLMAMIDPPREEVFQAVKNSIEAGIKPIMITGDHKTTAVAIAKQIGIFSTSDTALTGLELDALNNEELDNVLESTTVYARVSPENKIRIVDAWQNRGKIVAMTGDGVNDAPALKQANIGIAMGSGTDVAKDASDMILTDDNFSSIIKAVEVGRNVFDNIIKAIAYLFAGNLGAIIAIIFALIVGWHNPFTALQLLFINLVNDSLPAIALGLEKSEPTIMKRSPRDPKAGILSKNNLISVTYRGFLIGIMVIISQWIGMQESASLGVAMAFTTLIWSRTLQTLSARSNSESILKLGLFTNKIVILAIALSIMLYSITLLPGIREVFSIPNSFNATSMLIAIALAIVAVGLMELTKKVLAQPVTKGVKIMQPKAKN